MEYTSIIVEYIIITLTKPVVVFIIIYLFIYYIKKKPLLFICQRLYLLYGFEQTLSD